MACSKEHEHEHEEHELGHAHEHHAPHGGALGMLGDHAFQLEFVVNPGIDRIELYVLDGEAERFIRCEATAIAARALAENRSWNLTFEAVANAATGETVGNTSHFSASGQGLAQMPHFTIEFDRLELKGQIFESVIVPYPEGAHEH